MPDAVQFEFEGRPVTFTSASDDDHIVRVMRDLGTFYECDVLSRVRDRVRARGRAGAAIDAGGYIGTHSVFFAKLCDLPTVLAFEANPATFPVLCANVAANGAGGAVRPIHAALGACSGTGEIVAGPEGNRGMSRVRSSPGGAVRMTTVDAEAESAGLRDVSVLKVDVEGAELEVLDGAARVIATHHPVICVEVHTLSNLRAVLERLRSYWIVDCLGYSPTYVLETASAPRLRRAFVNGLWMVRAGLPQRCRRARAALRELAQACGAGRART